MDGRKDGWMDLLLFTFSNLDLQNRLDLQNWLDLQFWPSATLTGFLHRVYSWWCHCSSSSACLRRLMFVSWCLVVSRRKNPLSSTLSLQALGGNLFLLLPRSRASDLDCFQVWSNRFHIVSPFTPESPPGSGCLGFCCSEGDYAR